MPNVSIRVRLIFLSVLLLAILALSSALLIRELARNSRSLAEEAMLVSVVKNANSASKHFGDLKYWVIDLRSLSSPAPGKRQKPPRRGSIPI